MKVLFISDPLYIESEIYNCEGYANLPMLQAMPCDLMVATTAEQAKEYISDADVVLLESLRGVSFRDELAFINDHDRFVGAFYCDVWRGPFWYQSPIRVDLNISVYSAVALKLHNTWEEGRNFMWLPPRVNPTPYNPGRAIDIVTWGARGREYPYRNYTYMALLGVCVGTATKHGNNLTQNTVNICGHDYTWWSITGKRLKGPFYGQKLFDKLSHCKLCPTGPVIQAGVASPVARYFENAAAGVVSITDYLDDGEALGFIHGETIWDCGTEDFYPDTHRLLQDDDLRHKMSTQAAELIRERHSVTVRAQELYSKLEEVV